MLKKKLQKLLSDRGHTLKSIGEDEGVTKQSIGKRFASNCMERTLKLIYTYGFKIVEQEAEGVDVLHNTNTDAKETDTA